MQHGCKAAGHRLHAPPARHSNANAGAHALRWLTLTWAALRTVYAAISPKTGREFQFSDSARAQMTHLITMRAQTETIAPDARLVFGTRTFNIVEVVREDEIQHKLFIAAIEVVGASGGSASGSVIPAIQDVYETIEWDFTTTNTQTLTMPTGKYFYLDKVEVVCNTAGGTVTTQPTITVGITGSLTKYLSKLTTLLTAARLRQGYETLGANEGETSLIVRQTVAGAISAGSYRGVVVLKGVLVG